jgi:hypothetical protein
VNPDKTILIGLDTLAGEGSTYEEVRSSARNIYMRHYEASGRTRYSIR